MLVLREKYQFRADTITGLLKELRELSYSRYHIRCSEERFVAVNALYSFLFVADENDFQSWRDGDIKKFIAHFTHTHSLRYQLRKALSKEGFQV